MTKTRDCFAIDGQALHPHPEINSGQALNPLPLKGEDNDRRMAMMG